MIISQIARSVNTNNVFPLRPVYNISFKRGEKSDYEIKKDIIKSAKYMSERGLTAGSGGNISVRHGDKIFITTAGSRFCELSQDDICIVDLSGKILNIAENKRPSSELPLHLAVMRSRKDVNSVIHFHPVYTSLYAVANRTPLKSILPHTTKHFEDLKVAKYENAGSVDLAINTAKALGNSEAVIMGNHGALATGKDLLTAVKTADSLENYSQISYLIEKSGFPFHKLTPGQIAYMRPVKKSVSKDIQLEKFHAVAKTFISNPNNANPEKVKLIEDFLNNSKDVTVYKITVSANATIYRVHNGEQEVIIKMKHLTDNAENGVVKRKHSDFINEAFMLKQCPDIHTAKFLGEIKSKGDTIAIVMDFLDGKSLNANRGNLKPELLKKFYLDLLELDKNEFFHKDLSTNNILATETEAQIIDFGASKTYAQLLELSQQNTKYVMPDFIYPSNLENFEYIGLITYLRQLDNSNREGIASNLFGEHLTLKEDYHKARCNFLANSDLDYKDEMLENEKILYKTFKLFNETDDNDIKSAIKTLEILKMKTLNSQKMSRLFFENDIKNLVTGIYWNYQEGFYAKNYYNVAKSYAKKFKNNTILSNYFNLQMKIADFHYQKIYLPTIHKNTSAITRTLNENIHQNITPVINDGIRFSAKDINGEWVDACVGVYNNTPISTGEF